MFSELLSKNYEQYYCPCLAFKETKLIATSICEKAIKNKMQVKELMT